MATVVVVTVWCSACNEEWDVLLFPEERSGEIDPAYEEYVRCPECGRRGQWAQNDETGAEVPR
jgi:DNA-directed RNA polymerase subunit RPC12/RpoP